MNGKVNIMNEIYKNKIYDKKGKIIASWEKCDGPSTEIIKVTGDVEIDIIDVKTKKVIETRQYTNILVTNGLKMHRNWAAGIAPIDDSQFNVDTRVTHMALGDGNSAPAISQIALDNELIRKELYPTPDAGAGIDFIADNILQYIILINESELNGEVIRELALFSESQTPNFMISRFLAGSLSKTADVQFIIKYKFTYNG